MLPDQQVEFVIGLFLKYIYDGIGDVNHIDMNLRDLAASNDVGHLKIVIESVRERMTGEEDRKITGVDK